MQLLDHRRGVGWLTEELFRAHKRNPRVKFRYDPIGQNAAVAMNLQRMQGFNNDVLEPVTMRDLSSAAALVAQGLDKETAPDTLQISEDETLRRHATNCVWRDSGDNRLFGRKGGNDVSGIISGSLAVQGAVKAPRRRREALPGTLTG